MNNFIPLITLGNRVYHLESDLSLKDAWEILGKNVHSIISDIKSKPYNERPNVVKAYLVEAKQLAKHLMAKHHPDIGGSSEKFRKIQEALKTIENNTEEFLKNFVVRKPSGNIIIS